MPIDLDKFKIAYKKWVGESLPDYRAGNVQRQRRIIMDALEALKTITEPGTNQELPYKWNRPDPKII